MKPIISSKVVIEEALEEAALDRADDMAWKKFQARLEHNRVVRVVEARMMVKWLKATYVPEPKKEEAVTVENCHKLNRFGAVDRQVETQSNGDVIVTLNTLARYQTWIFNAQGELVTAVTYMDFGTDVPATRKHALERTEQRHTA